MSNFFSSLINNPRTSALTRAAGGTLGSIFGGPLGGLFGSHVANLLPTPQAKSQPMGLQGADYYKSLTQSSDPRMQQAGNSWLLRNQQPQTPQPSTPVKSVTNPDGTKTEYHAPIAPPQQQTTPPPPNQQNPSGNPYASNVLGAGGQTSQEKQTADQLAMASNQGQAKSLNDAYNAALQKSILLQAGQNNAQNAGLAGSSNTLSPQASGQLGTDYTNIFRPQSTGNMQGEKGILAPELSQGLQANAQQMAGILGEQQLATQGATTLQTGAQNTANRGLQGASTVLGAALPQGFSYGNNVINPLTGQSYGAGGAGQGGAFYGGQQQGAQAQGQQSAQLHTSYGSAQSVGNNLTQLIQSANINPADPQLLNSINQFLQTGVASNPKYQQFYGTINDYVASLAPILGVGGSPTDQKTSMAKEMVSQLASGKSIIDTIKYFDALAADKINAFDQSGSGNYGSVGGSGGGGWAESW